MIALRTTAPEAACLALVQPRGPWYAGRGLIMCASIGQADAVRAAVEVVEELDNPRLVLTSRQREREGIFVVACAGEGWIT